MVAVRYEEETSYTDDHLASSVGLRLIADHQGPDSSANNAQVDASVVTPNRALLVQFLVGLVFVLLLWAVVSVVSTSSSATSAQNGAAVLPSSHIVQPGETLWGIVRDREPNGDIRDEVDRLSEQLVGAQLQVGQVLWFDLDLAEAS